MKKTIEKYLSYDLKHLNLWSKVLLNFFVTLWAANKLLVWARLQDPTLVLGCCDWFKSLYMSICSLLSDIWMVADSSLLEVVPASAATWKPLPSLCLALQLVGFLCESQHLSLVWPSLLQWSILTPFWSQGRTFHQGIVRILLISQHHLSLALFPSNFSKHFIKRRQWFLSKNPSSHLI